MKRTYKVFIGESQPAFGIEKGEMYRVFRVGRGYSVREHENVYWFGVDFWRDLSEAEEVKILLEEYGI